jgi:peptidoglycan biosynthesis protein MviN/MurJ (putative lipid II flippase)
MVPLIALAATVSKTVKIVVLYLLLRRKLPRIEMRENLLFVVKALAAAALMAATIYGLDHIAKSLIPAGYMAGALKRAAVLTVRLGFCALAGLVVFGGASILLRMNEARLVVEGLRRRPGRRGEDIGGEGMMG